ARVAHRPLHSFPTRRSSDLAAQAQGPAGAQDPHLGLEGRGCLPARDGRVAADHRVLRALSGAPNRRGRRLREYAVELLYAEAARDRKSTRLNSSHQIISYAV